MLMITSGLWFFNVNLGNTETRVLTMYSSPHCFQALYVNPLDCYNIHWPIRRGQLNIHPGPGGSLTAVLADIEVIWSHAIQKYLEIPLKDLKVNRNSQLLDCL